MTQSIPFTLLLGLLTLGPPPWVISARAADNMTRVPAGEFLMGTPTGSDGLPDEQPQRRITLAPFWIDQYEVTNDAYARFVHATGHRAPANANPASTLWESNLPIAGIGNHPVVNISWEDAVAYCAWAGKRLPREAEWEKAARGTDGRLYPWGNDWDLTKANSASYWAGRTIDFSSGADWETFWINGEGARIAKEKGLKGEILTMPVGSFPDSVSPYGLHDMAGNAAEWVQDWYNPNYYAEAPLTDPHGPSRGAIKGMRGGSWLKPVISLRVSDRDWGLMDSRPSGTGVRCAKDAL
ncbi:MAG: Serine/threonine-protein kinase pkn1 [Nitrospira sp.]|nr:Serine/threonine-protein kinase pkn1 [Nitrospira sp.]